MGRFDRHRARRRRPDDINSDAHVGEGKRFVIIFGAGHKEWYLRELRKRCDIVILDAAPFLDRADARRGR